MTLTLLAALFVCILVVAVLYSSVGHGGASGYIALMALFALPTASIKPTALVLNILVAGIATCTYRRAGQFRWSVFWPFAVTSIPMSFVGGALQLPAIYFKPLLGAVLLFAAFRLVYRRVENPVPPSSPPQAVAAVIGMVLGFVSGLIGVGGGIFLSPLLLLFGWATPRQTAGISALFILVNSIAGLLGHVSSLGNVMHGSAWLAAAAVLGGLLGSALGSRLLPVPAILRTLSLVTFSAALKLILT
ncbi:sulfite exporter TauE/SafE family protein [Geomonas edaphica]|uniref:sulfite exporter TauE/SafE family protein n=1 Tax=Geomonas edaphica TaxID=2570226 RepID=UPI0010A93ED1|nr:sulfite exporter TauE/SafE family protein [Geomonas edaphica]